MPFYMQMSTDIEKIFVALIPLIQFISGFIISFVMELTAAKIGKELVFILGACLNITAGLVLGYVKGASFGLLIRVRHDKTMTSDNDYNNTCRKSRKYVI